MGNCVVYMPKGYFSIPLNADVICVRCTAFGIARTFQRHTNNVASWHIQLPALSVAQHNTAFYLNAAGTCFQFVWN